MSTEFKVYAYQHQKSWRFMGIYPTEALAVAAITDYTDEASSFDDGSKCFSVIPADGEPGDTEYRLPKGSWTPVLIG